MKLEISKRRKIEKFTNKQKLNNKLLANQRVNKEIKREMKNNCGKKMETYLNLSNEAKAVLRGKFRAINVYNKKKQRFQINNLTIFQGTKKMFSAEV